MSRPRIIDNIFRDDAKVGRFLSVLILYGIAYGLNRGVQDNYLAGIINIAPFERGIVEFFREMPGLLLIFILALMFRFSDSKVFRTGIAFMTGGIAGIFITSSVSFLMTKVIVVFFMVLFSTGEHIMMPIRSTISMDMSKSEKTGAALGINTSVIQLGNIAGFILVTVIFLIIEKMGFNRRDILGYRIVFGVATALMITASMTAASLSETKLKTPRQRLYFAKKFYKYYMLEVFYGSRKQIFLTFAPYVLIIQYGADPSIISVLFAISAVFVMFCGPLIGKLIDKVGYKAVMVGDTLILIAVCIMYGFSHKFFTPGIAFIIVSCNFVLDQIISVASMASNVYVKRICSNREEVTATLSTGISVNHIISVAIALLGGLIWKLAGIEVLFTISAILGLINSIYAATISKAEEYKE